MLEPDSAAATAEGVAAEGSHLTIYIQKFPSQSLICDVDAVQIAKFTCVQKFGIIFHIFHKESFFLFLPFARRAVRDVLPSLQKTKDLLDRCFLVFMRPPVARQIKKKQLMIIDDQWFHLFHASHKRYKLR